LRELCSRDKVSALFDERRDVRAGEKFADADLLGIPLRVVVGGRTSDGERIEVKRRTEQEVATVSLEHLTSLVVGS
jgi:prolyl-tRNA synthetase